MSERKYIFASSILLGCLMFLAGCNFGTELKTEYGKVAGRDGADSLNGVSVFADMFAQRGHTVKRRSKISPRIERFETIVWFPDDYSCPSEEAIEALNQWLANVDYYSKRTLIYIGRDYDSRMSYLNRVKDSAPIDQKEELLRQMAEARLAQDSQSEGDEFYWFDEDTASCEWFEHESLKRQKAKSLSGPIASGVDAGKSEIEYATILAATQETIDRTGDWESETMLEADSHPIILRLTDADMEYGESDLFVVANGSFLLNYSLINPEHRKLAGKLIDHCDPTGDVLFLESGSRGIDISDSDTINHNTWAWIAEPPLRYIVPHFLLWGILFCFVYFPIFGRPKRMKQTNISSFRSHIDATAKLIGRSDLPNRAVNKIRHYQQIVSHESKKSKKEH